MYIKNNIIPSHSMLVTGILIVFVVVCGAQETHKPDYTDMNSRIEQMQRDTEILRTELRKVRSLTFKHEKELELLKSVPRAIAELNEKIEAQIQNVQALSGELYRIGSLQENVAAKDSTYVTQVDNLKQELTTHTTMLEDMQDEIRILRKIQADMSSDVRPSSSRTSAPWWEQMRDWKYWGQTACGLALIALIIAL
ncbi:MAG: hypothetical protein GF384_00775 [Elusimicrobia bacterium]|nr:hypothetical protein [Elusimicrobiota bacterium]